MAGPPPAASLTASAIRSATSASPPLAAFEPPKPGSSGTITRWERESSGAIASKLARSDSSEWNRNNGVPSPVTAAFTVPFANVRSIRGLALTWGREEKTEPIDKTKRRLFKPYLLDVIFHECHKRAKFQQNLPCSCVTMSMKAYALIY